MMRSKERGFSKEEATLRIQAEIKLKEEQIARKGETRSRRK